MGNRRKSFLQEGIARVAQQATKEAATYYCQILQQSLVVSGRFDAQPLRPGISCPAPGRCGAWLHVCRSDQLLWSSIEPELIADQRREEKSALPRCRGD